MSTLTLARIEALLASIPPEPIGEWMRSRGYPPTKWDLVLPAFRRSGFPAPLPSYVLFSQAAAQPFFARRLSFENTEAIRQYGEEEEP